MKHFVLLLLAITSLESSFAGQAAIEWDGSGAQFFSDHDGPFVNGFEFRTESNITVTALGAFDYLGNGLATPHRVGIWSLAGSALLAEATVPPGLGGMLVGQFRYVSIPGLWLSAGSNYVIGASDYYGETNDIYAYGVTVGNFSTAREITFRTEREVMSVPGGLPFPTNTNNPPNGVNPGANFQFVPGPLLSISHASSLSLELSWTTNAAGFTLQSTLDLNPPATWVDVTNVPALLGGQWLVTNTFSDNARFYRLRNSGP